MGVFFRYYDLPAGFPVIALLGERWRSTSDPITRLHFHNCVEIGLLREGACKLVFEGEELTVQSPAVTVVPPNIPHYTQAYPGESCRWNWLYVDPIRLLSVLTPRQTDELRRYLHSAHGGDCAFSYEDAPELIRLTKIILNEMEKQGAHYKTVVRGLFTSFFLMLLRFSAASEGLAIHEQAHELGRIAPVIAYITKNYMNNVTVEELATLCHVSVTHLRRLFHQILEWSPQEYLHIVRIGHACDILYNEDCSITDVAIRVGYSAPSSLTRQFRRMYGISPNQWRKKARKEENPDVVSYFQTIPRFPPDAE